MKTLIAIVISAVAVFAAAETIVLQPGAEGKDAGLNETGPDSNYGESPILSLGFDSYGEKVILIEWDISSIPEYAEITYAQMDLYCAYLWGEMQGQIKLYRVVEYWNEMEVTWNDQPEYSDDVFTISDWPGEGTWAAFDVTEFVVGWYDGDFDNYGLRCNSTAGGYSYLATFYVSDYEDDGELRPKLTITYEVHDPDEAVEPASLGALKAAYR